MATFAYIDHSFHIKTKSNDFLCELLEAAGHKVIRFWDDSWQGGAPVSWSSVKRCDCVLMFQVLCPISEKYYRNLHPNVVFVPMLDQFGIWNGPLFDLTNFWHPLQGSKILSFSKAVHAMATGFGLRSHFVQYFPPADLPPERDRNPGLHGFYWMRRPSELGWDKVRCLIGDTKFDSLHIHLAHDPGNSSAMIPSEDEIRKHSISFSTWFENRDDYERLLAKANVFFAPRMEEGIGQAFLEAFKRGQCVVSPNEGTMNEYIVNGLNGLLFEKDHPRPLDFTNVSTIGANAILSALQGRRQWENNKESLLEFLLTSSEALYVGKYHHPELYGQSTGTFVTGAKAIIKSNPRMRRIAQIFKAKVRTLSR